MGKYALLIGGSKYDTFDPLPSASWDVKYFSEILEKVGFFVSVMENPEPQPMREYIESLFNECHRQRDDVILLYFSGHAFQDSTSELHLACRPTVQNSSATAISASFIHKQMQRSRARKQVIMLDCCFGATFVQKMLTPKGDTLVLTSSDFSYAAGEAHPETGCSIYTHYFLDGLRHLRELVEDEENLTFSQLHKYAEDSIRESGKGNVNPDKNPYHAGDSISIAPCSLFEDLRIQGWRSEESITDRQRDILCRLRVCRSFKLSGLEHIFEVFPSQHITSNFDLLKGFSHLEKYLEREKDTSEYLVKCREIRAVCEQCEAPQAEELHYAWYQWFFNTTLLNSFGVWTNISCSHANLLSNTMSSLKKIRGRRVLNALMSPF